MKSRAAEQTNKKQSEEICSLKVSLSKTMKRLYDMQRVKGESPPRGLNPTRAAADSVRASLKQHNVNVLFSVNGNASYNETR